MYRKLFSVQNLLWLALLLALVGSLRHVAWGFSTLELGDLTAGYVQAIAVDIGLFALAIGIQQRRRQGRRTPGLWAGVLLFSVVSTYANLLHGLAFQSDIGLDGWSWLVSARPFVLSGVLPVLVVYLSEVAAADVNFAVQQAEKERKAEERRQAKAVQGERQDERESSTPNALDAANRARLDKKAQALDALLVYLADHPNASLAAAGRAIGRSKTTVAVYLDELETAGRISRNGDGVKVNAG